ncbi:MAG: hypothetical protein J6K32_07565 [Clostridia bacterium]|nr:hypothetical protein [Clostridia bacterium]
MKQRYKRLLAGILCFGAASVAGGALVKDASASAITVNPHTGSDARPFEGWGTSLCWWANRLGYSDPLAQQSADLFFSPNGLGLNIMRYNIGGGDDPTHTHITRTDSAVPGWLVWDAQQQAFVYDYTADHRQLNVLMRAAKAAGSDAIVEVFSNSPPYFMTVSGCSSGSDNAVDNNLREECYDDFAQYLVHVTDYIQHELGVEVTSLSPMNEPDTDYWHANSWKQEGCHLDPGAVQSGVIKAAARALAQSRSTNVILAASDETSPEKQLAEYNAYTPEAREALGRINTHSYIEYGREELRQLAIDEGFNLWMSEVDGGDVAGENAGEMGAALWLGRKIIADLNTLSPTAWVLWQVVDNHISAEGFAGNKDSGMVDVNGGFWGLAVADHDRETIILTQKYYGMGQFSRYIRPGSTLIHCGDEAIAAYHPGTRELVIVAVNDRAADKDAHIDLSAFAKVGSSARMIRTSGSMQDGESWAELEPVAVEGGSINAALKGNSITTFIIADVEK